MSNTHVNKNKTQNVAPNHLSALQFLKNNIPVYNIFYQNNYINNYLFSLTLFFRRNRLTQSNEV